MIPLTAMAVAAFLFIVSGYNRKIPHWIPWVGYGLAMLCFLFYGRWK